MVEGLHLSPRHRKEIVAWLHKHLPGVEVWAYGSRVNGRSHDGSDLDLVLRSPQLAEIDASQLAEITESLRESTVPFLIEARDWARLPESFHCEIERAHVVLVEREESLGTASDGWVSLSLGEVCTKIGSGATPRGGKEVYLKDGPYALIRSQNVYNHRFNHDGLAFINQHQATELNNVEVFADDVLLNITGDSVARACQVAPDVLPARVNQHVAIIRPDPHKLSPHFLRYFLVCPEIQAMLLSWAGSGGTRNALTKGMIESFDVQAPMDVDEQRAIAPAVNQFTVVENRYEHRPDIVLFVNGLPLGMIELKNPVDEEATIWTAWQQLQTYQAELPALFAMNAALIVSDGVEARIGTLPGGSGSSPGVRSPERRWPTRTCPNCRWCSKASVRRAGSSGRDFIVFEDDGSGALVKKMAGYQIAVYTASGVDGCWAGSTSYAELDETGFLPYYMGIQSWGLCPVGRTCGERQAWRPGFWQILALMFGLVPA